MSVPLSEEPFFFFFFFFFFAFVVSLDTLYDDESDVTLITHLLYYPQPENLYYNLAIRAIK